MHKYFAEWYRAAGLQPKAEDLEKRWQGVENFAKEIKVQNAIELVRLFYARPPQGSDFVDTYSTTFQSADTTFHMRENGLELQVLAGATIAHIIEKTRTNVADALALAMLCGYCQGLRQNVLNGEIVGYARTYLAEKSIRVRESDGNFSVSAPDVDMDELLDALTSAATGNSLTVIKEPIRPPFEQLAGAISELATSINNVGEKFTHEINIRREESDILWWVFGEHSRDLDTIISELQMPFAALVAGKELADLVRVVPGPIAASAFLDKMLRFVDPDLSKAISIKDAINAAPREWRRRLIEETAARGIDDIYPVHLAMQKSLEFEKATEWLTPFDKIGDLKSKRAVAPLDLATQMYHERMLMRAVNIASAS